MSLIFGINPRCKGFFDSAFALVHANLLIESRFPNQSGSYSNSMPEARPAWMARAYSEDLRELVLPRLHSALLSRLGGFSFEVCW